MGFTGKKACQLKAEYIKAFEEYDSSTVKDVKTTERTGKNMEELATVNVRVENEQMITDSRNVAAVFGKQHGHVLRDIENIQKDVSNFGEMFFESTMPDSYGREQRVYLMNRDGFTLLAMGFTGKDAMQWKLKYIDAFNKLEKAWNSPEAIMARALQYANNQLEVITRQNQALTEKVQQDKPKVLFADSVAASQSSILVGELAKLIKQNGVEVGQQRMFTWLRNNGYLINRKGSDYNMPTQYSMELGLFEIKETSITHSDGHVSVSKTPKVTGKGQQFFINRFLGEK